MADLVVAKGMQFWGTHGMFPEENTYGAKYIIDVVAEADVFDMCQHDQFEGGLSYQLLYKKAEHVCTRERHKLLQRIAQRISDEIFDEAPQIKKLTVTVKKPFVPIGGIVEYTAATIERTGKGANSDGNAVPYTGIDPILEKEKQENGYV